MSPPSAAAAPTVRGGVLLVLVVVGAVLVARASAWTPLLDLPAAWPETDFQILWAAGQGAAEGLDVHDPLVLDDVGRRAGRPVTPFCAANPLVVRGFGHLPADFGAAYRLWLTVNTVLLVIGVALLARVLRAVGAGGAAAALALGVLLLADSTWMALSVNSTNLLALAAVLGALAAAQSGRGVLEGVLLAVAAAAKTSPALLIVVAACASRWRTVVAAGVTGAALLALSVSVQGWDVHASWIERVLPRLGYAPELEPGAFDNSLHLWNAAPAGWLARLAHAHDARAWVPFGAGIVSGAVLLALAVLGRRAATSPDDATPGGAHGALAVTGLYAAGLVATFLVSSVTWPHHLVLASLPVAWLVLRGWVDAGLLARLLAAAVVALLFLPLDAAVFADTADAGSSWRTAALAALFLLVFAQAWRDAEVPA